MMTSRGCVGVTVLVCALSAPVHAVEEPRNIQWDDLAPRLSPVENPFARLSMEQLELLTDVAGARDRKARGLAVPTEIAANERAAAAKLEKMGIDVDRLLAKREEVAKEQQALAAKVNTSLDGVLVRVPGYLLPLEFSGKEVTEFLLVPWVGACIHTPPPPPNQIVHVRPAKPVEIRGNFDAIWVTGRITVNGTRRSIYITDGTTEIDTGYAMRDARVERYHK